MKTSCPFAAKIILLTLLTAAVPAFAASAGAVREPAVAGVFYPAGREALSGMVNNLLANVHASSPEGQLIALIVPHAGYQFSGQVAAYAYAQLRGRPIDTVILLGPAHQARFSGAAVLTEGAMRTPLGDLPIDRQLARSLLNEKAGIVERPEAFDKEHSLEVQLPFLRTVLKNVSVVPVLISVPTRESFSRLVSALTERIRERRNVLVIASTDLSHYHDRQTARRMDGNAIDAMTRISLEDMERLLGSRESELCGAYPVLVAMAVARNLGSTQGVLYRSANSGDVTGDASSVVGYASLGLYRAGLNGRERSELLTLARNAIETTVRTGKLQAYEPSAQRLRANGAAFVTINSKGMLRGCIGNIDPVMPLYQAVRTNAAGAATRDPRFPRVTEDELRQLTVEVTLVSPFQKLHSVRDIRIGMHGLYLVKGTNAAVLLPQVAEENAWDIPAFLQQLSIKAGLPPEGWRGAELYTFTADVIR